VLTRVCTFTVDAKGARMRAEFDVSAPGFDADSSDAEIVDELDVDATYDVTRGTTTSSGVAMPAAIQDSDVITATIKVTFDYDATEQDSQDLSATLDEITVTAKQVDPNAA
jgi:alternate signal-mediated exported protein